MYEDDILDDPNQAAAALSSWVGVPYSAVVPGFARTGEAPLRDLVQNYGPLASALDQGGYGYMLG